MSYPRPLLLLVSLAIACSSSPSPAGPSASPAAAPDPVCDVTARLRATAPGGTAPPLRFGVTAAGLVFSQQRPKPDDPAKELAALAQLRGKRPIVVRVNRVFSTQGAAAVTRARTLTERYAKAGHLVTLQLRYGGPVPAKPESPERFAAWVREVVRTAGRSKALAGVEVTNEANLSSAPDNSDGSYDGVAQAVVLGVKAAVAERDRLGYRHVGVGFDWFDGVNPLLDDAFLESLRAAGGDFGAKLDWIGMNSYPGTYDTPRAAPGTEGAAVVASLRRLRECYAPRIGIPASTPIRVTENGWPAGTGRTPELQAQTLDRMVRAVHEQRAALNVRDYYWFTLRDTDSSLADNESHYGLLADDYTAKPAFATYRSLIRELGG